MTPTLMDPRSQGSILALTAHKIHRRISASREANDALRRAHFVDQRDGRDGQAERLRIMEAFLILVTVATWHEGCCAYGPLLMQT